MSAEILKRVAETVAEGEKTGLSEKLVLEAVRSVRPWPPFSQTCLLCAVLVMWDIDQSILLFSFSTKNRKSLAGMPSPSG